MDSRNRVHGSGQGRRYPGYMTEAPEHTIVTSLTDLVEVVPSLLGFHASDSVVLLALQDGHVQLTARTDLGQAPEHALAAAWRRLPTAEFILIAFTPDSGRAWAVLDEVGSALPVRCGRILVHADGERWFDHPDDVGTPYDALGSVRLAEAAFAGRPVRRSRAELYRLVEPGRTPAAVTASLERVAARELTLSDVVGEAWALLAAHDDHPGELDIDDATLLCLASHDPTFIDEAVLSTGRDNARARMSLWLQVVGATVPTCAGGALVAAGLAAWLAGDGALQSVCLESLDGRRGPAGWAEFLDTVTRGVLPPGEWPAVRAALRDQGGPTMPT